MPPKPRYDNRNELYFPTLNSRIKVTLDGRSVTATDLHITELAFIKNAKEMMAGTLPSAQNANITIETTANGINYFHGLWNRQVNNPNPMFYPHFVPWYTNPNYSKAIDEYFEVPEELKYLKEKFPITDEQLYRYVSDRKENGKMTKQEYPSDANEAFLTSGDTVFDAMLIK